MWLNLSVLANVAIALAYFWMPGLLLYWLARQQYVLPPKFMPWLRLGALFVITCGFHHVAHTFHLWQNPHHAPTAIGVIVDLWCAGVSVLAAVKLPSFLKLVQVWNFSG